MGNGRWTHEILAPARSRCGTLAVRVWPSAVGFLGAQRPKLGRRLLGSWDLGGPSLSKRLGPWAILHLRFIRVFHARVILCCDASGSEQLGRPWGISRCGKHAGKKRAEIAGKMRENCGKNAGGNCGKNAGTMREKCGKYAGRHFLKNRDLVPQNHRNRPRDYDFRNPREKL